MKEITIRMDVVALMNLPNHLIKPVADFLSLYELQEKELLEFITSQNKKQSVKKVNK